MARFWRRHFQRRSGEEAGAVLVIVCVAMVAMIGATGLAIDVGRVTVNNRNLQAQADVIAMDAGRAVNGQTAAQLSGSSGAVTLAVQNSASRNGVAFSKLTVELGTASGSTFTSAATSVVNGAIQTVTSTSVPNAVRVTASGTVNFAFSHGGKTTNRHAVASQTAIAGISVGSFLARVNTSTSLLNGFLGGLLGANLTLVGYTGIAAGSVTLGELRAQLGIGTVGQLLDTSASPITLKNLLNAIAAALFARGDPTSLAARADVVTLANATNASLSLNLGDLIDVQGTDADLAANTDLNVFQLIELAAEASSASAVSVTLGPSSLGGLGSLLNATGNSVSLKVIEPPQIAIGPATTDGSGNWVTSVHTAQVRLYIHLKPLGSVLGGLIDLPIYVEAASATASLRGITCATPVNNSSVNVHTDAQAVRVRVGTLSDINAANPTLTDATILNVLGIASVSARADVALAGSSTDLTFHGPFDWNNMQTVGSSSLGLGSLIQSQPLTLDLHVLGLGLGLGGVLSAVLAIVNPVLGAIDNGLLDPVLSGLGITLGGGDVTNWMLDCNALKLVN